MSDINKEFEALKQQFAALEGVANDSIAAIKALNDQIAELKAKNNASLTVENTKPEPVKNADPFEIKGVGTFTLKFPQFQIGNDVIKAVDIVKDAAAVKALYEKSPYLFIPVNK